MFLTEETTESSIFFLLEEEARILLHDRSTLTNTTLPEINRHIQRLKTLQSNILLDTGARIYYAKDRGFYLAATKEEHKQELYEYLFLDTDYRLAEIDMLAA